MNYGSALTVGSNAGTTLKGVKSCYLLDHLSFVENA
jgi:hypothetical protein